MSISHEMLVRMRIMQQTQQFVEDATTLKLGDDIWYELKRPIWSKVRTQGMHPIWYKIREDIWP